MRLVRVQVPEFRALKDVDISFEPEFNPQVFPLGSLNGGGKSTLLQLVFVLLHCSAHEERHQFIANMLERVTVPEGETSKLLASFELQDGEEKIELEFTLCNNEYLRKLDIDPIFNKEIVSFSVFDSKPTERVETIKSLNSEKDIKLKEKRIAFLNERLNEIYVTKPVKNSLDEITNLLNPLNSEENRIKIELIELSNELKRTENGNPKSISDSDKNLQSLKNNILKTIESKHQLYITSWNIETIPTGLICTFKDSKKNSKQIKSTLSRISSQIFLSAPSSQIYLFLDQKAKFQLFRKTEARNDLTYELELNKTKSILPNFLTFDVFAADFVASIIEKARNQDFKTLVDTGTSGENYQKIIAEFNALTQSKKVQPQLDDNAIITGIVFKNDEGIEIYPEDLSHGELKRLSIYIWLKSIPKDGNIVLIDEIENAFHPDWQRHIVDDLVEWAPRNQFILATHSYELCRGVTPAHVKELSPNLLP